MGKIIERVRAREVARKERFKKENPLYEAWARQQRAMTNAYNPDSPINSAYNSAYGSLNAALGNFGMIGDPCRLGQIIPVAIPDKKPWWRFW